MIGSQAQRLVLPSSTSERQGHKLLGVPRGIYQVIQKVLSNFHSKITEKEKFAIKQKESNLIEIVSTHYQVYKKSFF